MKERISREYQELVMDLKRDYDKVYVIDKYDFYKSNAYTIFYLNKQDKFNDFKELWNKTLDENMSEDYDTILDEFDKVASEKFDYIELGTLNIYTDKDYELEI